LSNTILNLQGCKVQNKTFDFNCSYNKENLYIYDLEIYTYEDNIEVSFHFIQKGAVLNLQGCKNSGKPITNITIISNNIYCISYTYL